MRVNGMNRFLLVSAPCLLVLGCSSYQEVPRSELERQSSYEQVRVATVDGFEYRFHRAVVIPDTLVGFYKVTEERVGPKEIIYYEDVERRYGISLARVARLTLVRKDPVRTVVYGGVIAAAGYFLVNFVDERSRGSSGHTGGGKGGINP